MRKIFLLTPILCCVSLAVLSQGFTRQTFHDREKKHLKEVYQVKDTLKNILHGRYISYYLNGNIESKGQFTNNETTGIWEFYYETGNLKMRGILRQNANYGLWEYFYESGQKSMEGNINGKHREGEWKMYFENGQVKESGEYKNDKRIGLWQNYFEDGVLKGEIEYADDHGTYTEYYHSGKVYAEGPRLGTKNVGHWRYFAEDGTLHSEGEYVNNKKHGEWTTYFASAKPSSKGTYINDKPTGKWEYFFEDGTTSQAGEYVEGKKTGYWRTMNQDGSTRIEVTYENNVGQYREYFGNGKLKTKGTLLQEKKNGKWQYYYEDGKLEGECDFENGKGTYYGYYPNGNLQTKGTMEGDIKTGTWEIYENDGKLSGYYRPFYDDRKLGKEITSLANKAKGKSTVSSKRRNLGYFDSRFNEFQGVILSTNPVMVFTGRVPIGVEFYLQERLGHEFEFIGIRDPFFTADSKIAAGKKFERGYAICIKQKFYNQLKAGMWYFGHEFRFTNFGHFVNEVVNSNNEVLTFSAVEQKIQWGPLCGYRIMKRNNAKGFTIDATASCNVGYRGFDVDARYNSFFEDVRRSRLATSVHFSLKFGHVFSFR